jgi:lipid-binding SYLF domain-containing protein
MSDYYVFVLVSLILKAKGLAILTVFKLGFLVTARGGSGIVIAKLSNGCKYVDVRFSI